MGTRWIHKCIFVLGALAAAQCSSNSTETGAITTQQQALVDPNVDAKVAVVQSSRASVLDITLDDIRAQVRQAVELAGGFAIKNGDTVVLKPNLVGINDFSLGGWAGVPMPPGETPGVNVNGVTTDFRVTRAVVELVREKNPSGKVYVMEGSATSTTAAFTHYRYTPTDIPGVDAFIALETSSGGWQETTSPLLVPVQPAEYKLHDVYYLNKIYKEANYLISIPTLKNHFNAVLTGGIKNVGIGATPANIYGSSPTAYDRNLNIPHGNAGLHWHIRDWYVARPIDFVVMDGLQGIQNGPTPNPDYTGHSPVLDRMNMRLIVAGPDAVAVDTVESLIAGWDPASVEYLRLLSVEGYGQGDTAKIRVLGKRVDEVRKYFEGVTWTQAGGFGAKITDTTPPAMTSVSVTQVDNGKIRLSLTADPTDLTRVEVSLGSHVLAPVTGNYTDVILDISALPEGSYNVLVEGFDKFRNRAFVQPSNVITRGCLLNKLTVTTAVASSIENAGTPASAAFDGSLTTRWASAFSDPQWIYADLGAKSHIGRVVLRWEGAYGKDYDVQVSDTAANEASWTRVAGETAGTGGAKTFDLNTAGRYVRMYSRARGTAWGNSLWELEIYGDTNVSCGQSSCSCTGKVCGDNGCGASCGTCQSGQTCNAGQCVCAPSCTGKVCGDNGCGGSCGTCGSGQTCNTSGQCTTPGTCLSNPLTPSGATASSVQDDNAAFAATNAIDTNVGTRWSSKAADPQWLRLDFGQSRHFDKVVLTWEAAASADYEIQVSDDDVSFRTVATNPAGHGGTETISGLNASARYLRIHSTKRTTGHGVSLWEVAVSGDPNPACDGSDGGVCSCTGKVCGDNGCGASCGTCGTGQTCNAGQCVCVPNCTGKVCGDNGCGGTCGTCGTGQTCNAGQCVCVPNCTGKVCGDNGCGGTCGTCGTGLTCNAGACQPGGTTCTDVALTRASATASSTENGGTPASYAIDGVATTRWASAFSDPQWIYVDLGAPKFVKRVVLKWETASSADYDIGTSLNATDWTKVYTGKATGASNDSITSGLGVVTRYLRMYSRTRNTGYGNSLWEFEAYGDPNTSCTP